MSDGEATRRRPTLRAWLAGLAVLLVALPLTARSTTAAWTDPAVVTAAATAASWPLPALSCRVPANPAVTCTATFGDGGSGWWWLIGYDRQVVVTTASPAPVVWEVTLSPSAQGWPIAGATKLHDLDGRVDLVGASACSADPLWATVKGSAGYQQVSSAAATVFRIRVPGLLAAGNDLLNC